MSSAHVWPDPALIVSGLSDTAADAAPADATNPETTNESNTKGSSKRLIEPLPFVWRGPYQAISDCRVAGSVIEQATYRTRP